MAGSIVLQANRATISPGGSLGRQIRRAQFRRSVGCAEFRPAFQNKQRIAHPQEDILSQERRIAPRKVYTMPVRVRVRTDVLAPAVQQRECTRGERAVATRVPNVLDGETVNISELGIYFKSSEHIAFGEELEICFRLLGELTGRSPEDVRCNARVVHVNASIDAKGTSGIGVAIGRFAKRSP